MKNQIEHDGCIGCKYEESSFSFCRSISCKGAIDPHTVEYDTAVDKYEPANSTIKDSGDRTEFSTGAKRDMHTGKGRMDLLPWDAIMEVSKHCENGALKYGERNVDKGIPIHSFLDSAFRHLAKYMEGWDDEPHLVAAAWNILWAMQTERMYPELQDIPSRKELEA